MNASIVEFLSRGKEDWWFFLAFRRREKKTDYNSKVKILISLLNKRLFTSSSILAILSVPMKPRSSNCFLFSLCLLLSSSYLWYLRYLSCLVSSAGASFVFSAPPGFWFLTFPSCSAICRSLYLMQRVVLKYPGSSKIFVPSKIYFYSLFLGQQCRTKIN